LSSHRRFSREFLRVQLGADNGARIVEVHPMEFSPMSLVATLCELLANPDSVLAALGLEREQLQAELRRALGR
jgi:hypothetical protein